MSKLRSVFARAALLLSLALTACHVGPKAAAPILLFSGAGTSPHDVAALEELLTSQHLEYAKVNSPQLDGIAESQLRAYRLLIVPGGNFEQIGNRLQPATTARVRAAIRNGLNYLGICAGAFFAGDSPYNGLNLTPGVRFSFYGAEGQGIRKAAIPISSAAGPILEQYWEDGPQLAGWGSVVSKYPDETPATVEGTYGNGWLILTGIHPEAPASWRRGMEFQTSAADDNAYAVLLIRAALNRQELAHF